MPTTGVAPVKSFFRIGPDQARDLRTLRPYFLVPMDFGSELAGVKGRIVKALDAGAEPVTDVYVLSHGWHRNFFSAVEAYDRLIHALSVLRRRGRLQPARPYRPLFLTLHWHSDPGQDGWVDKEGRRHLASFMDNVERAFVRPVPAVDLARPVVARVTTVFEDVFEYFARLSAPDTDALGNPDLDPRSNPVLGELADRLAAFELRDAPDGTPAEKVTAAWSCYSRALPKRMLADQQEPPGRFIAPGAAARGLVEFIIKAVGLVALLSFVMSSWSKLPWLPKLVAAAWGSLVGGLGFWPAVVLLPVVSFAVSWLHLARTAPEGRGGVLRPGTSVSVLRLAMWAYLQIVCTLPIVVYAFVTYFTGWVSFGGTTIPGLFDERFGKRNGPIAAVDTSAKRWSPRWWLARLARWPLGLLRRAVPQDSSVNRLADELESQLAFWEMQYLGVETGMHAAGFIADLLTDARVRPHLAGDVRVHLMGHSFGGLVVSNLLRRLALDATLHFPGPVHSLTLLQGALGSAWFVDEAHVIARVKGAVACVFSRYDTANGFYYPVANHGRLAAGHVGLCSVGAGRLPDRLPALSDPLANQDRGLFASLTQPPDLQKILRSRSSADGPWILNLDASRMIYEGGVLTGGGHGDIFKNDVIHLVWAVTQLA